MKAQNVYKFDQEFLKVRLMPVMQKAKKFYLAIIPAKEFLELYTVEPAEYDIEKQAVFALSFTDDKDYYDYLIDEDKKKIDTKAFERKENLKRVKEISNFLNTEEYALFPNSIIATCDLINDLYDIEPDRRFDDLAEKDLRPGEVRNLSYLEISNGSYFLYIPCVKNSILIIDGQHRLKGLKNAGQSVKDNYDLLVSFIIQFDRPVLAKLFYTINYTQKSVNKSLLYHLSGEFSREIDVITFWHETVRMLNELKDSPFFKRVKMLGAIPEGTPPEEKKLMTVSQAFLIDYLKNTTTGQAKESIHLPIFLHYYKHRNLQIEIIRFLIKYFKAVTTIKEKEWKNPEMSMVSKTLGVGALIRVLHFLFVKMYIDEFDKDPLRIKTVTVEHLVKKLKGLEKIDFSAGGEFGGVSSAGSLNKLKKKMIETIEYFGADNYDNFLDSYKKAYWKEFKAQL
jgi:DGQHR domain-containing protein